MVLVKRFARLAFPFASSFLIGLLQEIALPVWNGFNIARFVGCLLLVSRVVFRRYIHSRSRAFFFSFFFLNYLLRSILTRSRFRRIVARPSFKITSDVTKRNIVSFYFILERKSRGFYLRGKSRGNKPVNKNSSSPLCNIFWRFLYILSNLLLGVPFLQRQTQTKKKSGHELKPLARARARTPVPFEFFSHSWMFWDFFLLLLLLFLS